MSFGISALRSASFLLTTLGGLVSAVTYPNLQKGAQVQLNASSLEFSGQLVQVHIVADVVCCDHNQASTPSLAYGTRCP